MQDAPLITQVSEFKELMGRLSDEPSVALDTEASSFHRFHERIGLIQLSNRDETWLLDPLALKNVKELGHVLGSERGETVIHDADFDLRLLKHMYGFRVRHIFDTLIAAELINEPELGLAALLKKYFGLKLDKRYQKADWCKRPLTPGMLSYAAMDTRYLIALRDELEAGLRAKGRWHWATEEFGLLTEIPFKSKEDGKPGFLRLKGAKALKPKELAILRELYEWRNGVASKIDRAPFMVLGNEVLLKLAQEPVSDLGALAALKGVGASLVDKHGLEILEALERGIRMPKELWPRIEKPKRRPRDPQLDERVKRLKAVRDKLATEHELRPGIVAANHLLKDIALAKPANREDLLAISDMRRYQAEEFGPELLTVI